MAYRKLNWRRYVTAPTSPPKSLKRRWQCCYYMNQCCILSCLYWRIIYVYHRVQAYSYSNFSCPSSLLFLLANSAYCRSHYCAYCSIEVTDAITIRRTGCDGPIDFAFLGQRGIRLLRTLPSFLFFLDLSAERIIADVRCVVIATG